MPVLSANGLSVSYGPDDIFQNISLEVPDGARVALIGPNGSGKTSLLRLLAGLDKPRDGQVHIARGTQVGYLAQHPALPEGKRLYDALREVMVEVDSLAEQLREVEHAMAATPTAQGDPDLLETYGRLQQAYEAAGGYTVDSDVRRVLTGLGFAEEDLERPVTDLSGGQRTRAALGRILLESPDLMLLDEPTNHLDVDAIEWLEGFLRTWSGALVVVAHDRAFLDNTVDRVWELMGGRLERYRGNYSAYATQREERLQRRLAAFARQQAEIERTEEFVRRNLAGQNTRQAQGRRTRLERLERLERPESYKPPAVGLATAARSGDRVLRLMNLAAGYGTQVVVRVDEAEVWRGDSIALLGANGSGKTTLLRTIVGELPPLAGRAELGAAVQVGYFAQTQAELDPTRTLYDHIMTAVEQTPEQARAYLGRYGFSGDDAFKKIQVLSGGERARLALALLELAGANLLLLDEPTNHLDIASQETLQAVLSEFDGTILLVSHDRFLIRSLAGQVWALRDGTLHVFPEGYASYEAWRREGADDAADDAKAARVATYEEARQRERAAERAAAAAKRRRQQLEDDAERLEAELRLLAKKLEAASAAQDVDAVARLGAAYTRAETERDACLEEWMELGEPPAEPPAP